MPPRRIREIYASKAAGVLSAWLPYEAFCIITQPLENCKLSHDSVRRAQKAGDYLLSSTSLYSASYTLPPLGAWPAPGWPPWGAWPS